MQKNWFKKNSWTLFFFIFALFDDFWKVFLHFFIIWWFLKGFFFIFALFDDFWKVFSVFRAYLYASNKLSLNLSDISSTVNQLFVDIYYFKPWYLDLWGKVTKVQEGGEWPPHLAQPVFVYIHIFCLLLLNSVFSPVRLDFSCFV